MYREKFIERMIELINRMVEKYSGNNGSRGMNEDDKIEVESYLSLISVMTELEYDNILDYFRKDIEEMIFNLVRVNYDTSISTLILLLISHLLYEEVSKFLKLIFRSTYI